MHKRIALNLLLLLIPISVIAQQTSAPPAQSGTKPVEGDYAIHDFIFAAGSSWQSCGCTIALSAPCSVTLPAWCAMQC
jgi:hypothetical protein